MAMLYFTDRIDEYFAVSDKQAICIVDLVTNPTDLAKMLPRSPDGRIKPFMSYFHDFYKKASLFKNMEFGVCQNLNPFLLKDERIPLKVGTIIVVCLDDDSSKYSVYTVVARLVQGEVVYHD